jgi:hypothetical protein
MLKSRGFQHDSFILSLITTRKVKENTENISFPVFWHPRRDSNALHSA